MKNAHVAIIVLNWQKPKDTTDCLKSLLSSSYLKYKIFLIDNHSKDNSFSILKKEFQNNPKVNLISFKENLGFAKGNNRGVETVLRKTNFDYLCFLNNDTLVDRDFLKNLIRAKDKFGTDNIYQPLILSWGSNRIQGGGLNDFTPSPFQFRHKGKDKSDLAREEEIPYISGVCFFIKKSVFSKLKGFREDYYMYQEDVDLSLRAKKLGCRLILVPKAKIWHRGGSGYSPLPLYYSVRNTFYLIQEHSKRKYFDFFRASFWYSFILFYNMFRLKLKNSQAIVLGIGAFLQKERGEAKIFSK